MKKNVLLIKKETTYGTSPGPGLSIELLRKPASLGTLPIDEKVRMLTIEGRVELTQAGVRSAARFLRRAADRLEGLALTTSRSRKRSKT